MSKSSNPFYAGDRLLISGSAGDNIVLKTCSDVSLADNIDQFTRQIYDDFIKIIQNSDALDKQTATELYYNTTGQLAQLRKLSDNLLINTSILEEVRKSTAEAISLPIPLTKGDD